MILFLLILIFASKISVAFVPFVPSELSPIIFQHGMHPYVNIFISLSIGSLVILKWLLNPNHLYSQSRIYRILLVIGCIYLISITFMQCLFVNSEESFVLQMAAAFLASFTIILYGRIIPTSLKPEKFIQILKFITLSLCWMGLISLFIFSGTSYKGARFIGIFKHIPHMVSCATLACFCLMYDFAKPKSSWAQVFFSGLNFAVATILLILTGTRSALASILFGLVIMVIVFPSRSAANRFLKLAVTLSALLVALFFGDAMTGYAMDIARGEKSIGARAAQDGIASRMEEVERGYQIFLKDQWLGQGLLSKFSSGNEAEINNYNANKDPHNILISAGVVGGWGLIILTSIMMISLFVASLKSLRSKNYAIRILAIYALSQIPILIIYHLHVSIGGIADRIYWIVFGYMALSESNVNATKVSNAN